MICQRCRCSKSASNSFLCKYCNEMSKITEKMLKDEKKKRLEEYFERLRLEKKLGML